MRARLFVLLPLALAGAGPAVAAQITAAPGPTPEPPCEAMARAAYSAARADAETGFWMAVALAANESGQQLPGKLKEAWLARREARAEALVQYQARLRVCAELGHGSYAPVLEPAQFSEQVTAPWLALRPGRVWVYESATALGLERIETTVLAEPRLIGGVPCRATDTQEWLDGELKERAVEWYSQDAQGAVWYLGEITQEFADGLPVAMDGSWRAGVDGAMAGMILPHAPRVGDAYRMEFLLGEAEDVARVVAVEQTVTVPAGTFEHCVAVEEWSPIDLRELVLKYYAPSAGMVLEVNQRTGERLELLELR